MPLDLTEVAGLAIMALVLVCNAPITRIGSTRDNFDRRIARAPGYRGRHTNLPTLRAKLNVVGSEPDQFLSFDVFPQITDVFFASSSLGVELGSVRRGLSNCSGPIGNVQSVQ